ncbi:MAG TPA: hypothetical protein VHW23_24395, partial [Kofleriaceae bacterium]|nr:hypothetical protein [Kofleriaceae bacterium]
MDKLPEDATEPRWTTGSPTLHQITVDIAAPMEGKPGRLWYACLAVSVTLLMVLLTAATYLI